MSARIAGAHYLGKIVTARGLISGKVPDHAAAT
ncbi:hypothetical protein GGD62_008313 [Bradyrhizobium sp. ERR14]|nr:hypothetical protein [Bradyrhizobium sp. ERR14]